MNVQIFGKSKCFDTKKAERWFKERRIKFQSIDLKRYGMSNGEFESVLRAVGGVENLIDWDSKEMELNSGAIDCIWNGMSITDARLESMFIPKAYIANTQIVIVEASSGIKTKADLAGKTVGLQKGSASLDAFNADAATAASVKEVVEYADNIECFLDLQSGRIDAFVVYAVLGRYILAQN